MIEIASYPQARRTHEVFNQPPLLIDYNLFSTDQVLCDALKREGAAWAFDQAFSFGKLVGSKEAISWGFQSNQNPPILHTHDRNGNRIDEVEFHPAWHHLMSFSIGHRLHSLPWREPINGAHVARAVLMMLAGQNEAGHLCPVSMTHAAIPALRKEPRLANKWEPFVCASTYDFRLIPVSAKGSAMIGMAMTEKQGGSDVRINSTYAQSFASGADGEYLITGHKWFCSAPMSDAFLILAKTNKGISCFLVPRILPDGQRNNIFIQRLKNKLGNRSNASSEIEFDQAVGFMVGEEGRGITTIIEMVNHTRLDCTIISASLMRQALVQAIHYCSHRSAFGKTLVDQSLMKNVLADLCLESEAATLLMMRLARAYDDKEHNEEESSLARISTAIGKYWLCRRAPVHVGEALECLGGNGYVEDTVMPRLYREAPVNSIWEGSGNIICLDVTRAMKREPETLEALLKEIKRGSAIDSSFDLFIRQLEVEVKNAAEDEGQARRLVEKMALALEASLLLRYSPPTVARAFCSSRLEGDWGHAFGTLSSAISFDAIIDRARVN